MPYFILLNILVNEGGGGHKDLYQINKVLSHLVNQEKIGRWQRDRLDLCFI